VDGSNRPVTSREYKLMLNVDRFRDRRQASQEFFGLLDFLVGKEGGSVEEAQDEEESRRTSYLDTPEVALHQQGFALRLREEGDDAKVFQVNLKYRDPDRYVSASQDVSSPQADKTKFEEDILPPFTSRFSHSTSIESGTLPELGSMKKVMDLFPGLRDLDIDKDAAVKRVNDFEALEVVRKLCKLEFGGPPAIKASFEFLVFAGRSGWMASRRGVLIRLRRARRWGKRRNVGILSLRGGQGSRAPIQSTAKPGRVVRSRRDHEDGLRSRGAVILPDVDPRRDWPKTHVRNRC
jgi:hypothetical protein